MPRHCFLFVQHVLRLVQLCAAANPQVVVFHCMESVMRGPRCAIAFDACVYHLQKSHSTHLAVRGAREHPRVCVLKGGFDRWVRKHYRDAGFVDGFDDEYWGFASPASGANQ